MQENMLCPNAGTHTQAFQLLNLGVYFMETRRWLRFHVNLAVTNKGNKETPAP